MFGGGYWWWQSNANPEVPQETESEMMEVQGVMEDGVVKETMMEDGVSSAPMSASVSYNGSSFSPVKISIKKGGTVTWTNTGDTSMWVASAQHPTHTVYAGTNLEEHCASGANDSFDQCKAGDSYSFTFDKVDTWNYHDHLHASVFGSVEVVE